MTLYDTRPPLQYVLDYQYTFLEWAVKRLEIFFPPEEDNEYDLTSVVHFLIKRLKQDYDKLMAMDSETRKKFFQLEKKVYDEEVRQQQK